MRPAALLLLAVATAPPAFAGDTAALRLPSLGITAGLFEFTDDTYREGELGLQFRPAARWNVVHPIVGGMVNAAGAFNLYVGVALDLPAGRHWLFRGTFAPGYYDKGASGKDLGLDLEFRSSLEIAWRLEGGWRFGIEIYHLSNGDLGRINPGDGSLVLTVTVPLGGRSQGVRPASTGPPPARPANSRLDLSGMLHDPFRLTEGKSAWNSRSSERSGSWPRP